MALKAQKMNHSTNLKRKLSRSEDKGKQILNPIEDIIDLEILHSNRGTTISNAISVEHYSHEIDLHLAIRASLGLPISPLHHQHLIDLSESDHDDHQDLEILQSKPKKTRFRKRRRNPHACCSSSDSTPLICEICTETKEREEFLSISGCSHAYCSMCISRYVGCKLEENIVKIGCPASGCREMLDPEGCRLILAAEVFDKWGRALCEDVILESEKFYCPYKDCSALFIDDGGEGMKETECLNCRRAFCVQCKVVWHAGIDCEKFQRLREDERGSEDILLMNLAKEKRWSRCPHCGFYVEKISGCANMTCRCGKSFYYTGSMPQVANNNFFAGNMQVVPQVANNHWIGPFLEQLSLFKNNFKKNGVL